MNPLEQEIAKLEARIAELKAKHNVPDTPKKSKKQVKELQTCYLCNKSDSGLTKVGNKGYAHIECLPFIETVQDTPKVKQTVMYIALSFDTGVSTNDILAIISRNLPNINLRVMNTMVVEK